MEAPTILPPETDPLEAFCRKFLSENEANWPSDEKSLAESFAAHFNAPPIFDLESFIEFCNPLGITVSSQAIPYELRGYNSVYGAKRMILISEEQDFPSADLHTAFHELREILEYIFIGLGKPTFTGKDLEKRADEFATFARMTGHFKFGGMIFDDAKKIEHTWKRRGAYILIFAATAFMSFMCVLLPAMEESNRKRLQKRLDT